MVLLGTISDGTQVTGKIDIPEVAHDTDSDDYVVSEPYNTGLVCLPDLVQLIPDH